MDERVTHTPDGCLRHRWLRMHEDVLAWSFIAAEQVSYWGA